MHNVLNKVCINTTDHNNSNTSINIDVNDETNITVNDAQNYRKPNNTDNLPTNDIEDEYIDKTLNDRPSKLYFNPLRQCDENEAIIYDNTCEYFSNQEFNTNVNTINDLSILNFNIRSMSKNIDKLKEYLEVLNHKFSIIALQETWFQDNNPIDYFNLDNYCLETVNRIDCKVGGVGFYILNNIDYKLRHDLMCQNEVYESCFIEINRSDDKNIILGVLYRHHNHSINEFNSQLETVLSKITSENKLFYLCGDFNIDIFKKEEKFINNFIDMMYSYSLYPLILRPTRITKKSETLIDNIFTNDAINKTSGIFISDASDHFPNFTISKIKIKSSVNNNKKVRDFSEENVSNLKTNMANYKWNDLFKLTDNANTAYDKFIKTFSTMLDKYTPFKRKRKFRNKSSLPWITRDIIKMINKKNRLYKKYMNKRTNQNKTKYKTLNNKVNKALRTAKKNYFSNQIENEKRNIKNTWKILNNALNKNQYKPCNTEFNLDGRIINNPSEVSDHFNDFFINVGPNQASQIPNNDIHFSTYMNNYNESSMFFSPTTEEEVIRLIKNLDAKKSTGHDNISILIIKKLANELSIPLTYIFNLSLSSGIVPDQLKIARVVPIHKKESKDVFSNYRPISVLPGFSKILERLVFNRCISFLNKHKILYDDQFGFRPKHSTNMAIIKLIDKIVQATNNDEITAGLFLDLSKAFDTIQHDILLDKMAHYGIRGLALEWFKNYLSNRKQFVDYNSHISELKLISSGMPQGSILGPLGFIIYVNDIPNSVPNLSLILFADDTSAFTSHKDISTLNNIMNNGLNKLNQWFQSNKLSLNTKKSNFMLFGTHIKTKQYKNELKLSLDNVELKCVDAAKFLGVTIDQNLTWENHINQLTKKCSSSIGILFKMKNFLPETALLSLYNTLVLSHINYGITAWSSAGVSDKSRVHVLQKRALRAISHSEFRSHSNPLFIKYNQLKINDLCKLNIGSFMYKYCNNLLPSTFNLMFTTNSDTHNYNTRFASNFRYPKNKLEFGKKSISYRGVETWNSISDEIKSCDKIKGFKSTYKKYLVSKY